MRVVADPSVGSLIVLDDCDEALTCSGSTVSVAESTASGEAP